MTIHDQDDVESVEQYTEAYCPTCDAHYSVHRDGECVQCGTSLGFEPDYAGLIADGYAGIVRDLAETHAPSSDSSHSVCEYCCGQTPLAKESSLDVPKAGAVEDVIDRAARAIEDLGVDPYWVRPDLSESYHEAYYDACAPAAECHVCTDAARARDLTCGHDESDVPCPARDEDGESA